MRIASEAVLGPIPTGKMGSYYSPYEASTSDMLHTQHPTDFEMDHFLALGNSPLLGPVGKGLGGGMKELGDSLDADAGGRTVRAGRGTMFGDLVPISDAYPVPVSESLTSFLSGPDGHNPGEEAFGKSLHEPNLLESFLEKEHPPSAVLRDEGGDGMQTGGQMLPPYREGFEGSAHGALRSSHRTRDFMSGGHPSQGMYDGSVHQAGGYDGCAHRGHVFDGSGHGFEGSAHGGQGFDGAGHHSRGYDGSTHRSQVYEGSSHRVPGFEGSGHHGQAFEGSQHSQGFDGAVTQVSAFPQGVQALSSSPTGGVQVFSTTGHGFSTSFAASDSSFSIPLNSAEQYARTVSHSLAGSSGGTSSQGGDYYSTEMGGSDGSFRGGGLLNSVLVQGPNFLPNGQRMCAWRGCEIAARGRTAFCIVHGGGKKCATEECSNAAEGRTKYCKVHGGGKSCSVEGCQKSAGKEDQPGEAFG